MDVAYGSMVSLQVKQVPRSSGGRQTLTRLLARDPDVARAQRQRKHARPSWETWRRGGKMWHHQMKSKPPVRLEPGATYKVRATVDLMRDLESVKQYVEIKPA